MTWTVDRAHEWLDSERYLPPPPREYQFYAVDDERGCDIDLYTEWVNVQQRRSRQWKGFNNARQLLNWLTALAVTDGRVHPDGPLPIRRSAIGRLPEGYRYYVVADTNSVYGAWEIVNSLNPRFYRPFNNLQHAHKWLER